MRPHFKCMNRLLTINLLYALAGVAAFAETAPSQRLEPLIASFIPEGYAPIAKGQADFNGDGLVDVVLVVARLADPDPEADRPLLVLFRRPDGAFVLSHRSDRAIPTKGMGGTASQDGFAGLRVERNTFLIEKYGGSSVREDASWRFRFQDSDWFLIGETSGAYGEGVDCPGATPAGRRVCMGYEVDTNFLTRRQIIKIRYYDPVSAKYSTQLMRRTVRVERHVRLGDFEPLNWAVIP